MVDTIHNIDDICFYSSLIDNIKFVKNSMILYVNNIYIRKKPITQSKIIIKNIEFKSAKFFGYTDKNTNNIVPDLFVDLSNIHNDLFKMLEYYPEIFSGKKISDNEYTFTIMYSSEVVHLTFSFSEISIDF